MSCVHWINLLSRIWQLLLASGNTLRGYFYCQVWERTSKVLGRKTNGSGSPTGLKMLPTVDQSTRSLSLRAVRLVTKVIACAGASMAVRAITRHVPSRYRSIWLTQCFWKYKAITNCFDYLRLTACRKARLEHDHAYFSGLGYSQWHVI